MTLEELQALKLSDLKNAFEEYMQRPVVKTKIESSKADILVDGGYIDKTNFENGRDLELPSIRTADNQTISLKVEDYDRIINDILTNGLRIYQKKWEYENTINSAESLTDLDDLVFNFDE